ncbi:hypothetical protein LWC34_01905 [Kibdelosporangium philippinense]|uniref:WXG100 family type VII secretion target n=1 Tax=Kibdelosporangium philippinense TaxID=211113 RepID=A0ABS8Z6X6_9PSEU|nr:hypothetical protein [Kibdelosporangium philippinense]MCE7001602.1 hypothetical protein [Kibdelosporangium philippinense]
MTYIEFKDGDIARIAQATQGSQQEWDRVWEGVRGKLTATVSEALDALTGSSLEERSTQYHQKTQQYTAQLQSQMNAVRNVGNIAVDTNQQMSRVIRG